MVKCPFCHYDNEDGALFCEQCKSDLAGVEPAMTAEPIEAVVPIAEAEIIETVPLMGVPEGTPIIEAAIIGESAVLAEAVPIVEAMPAEVMPMEPMEPIETIPLATEVMAEPVAPPPPPPAAKAPPPAPKAPPPPPAPAPVAAAPPPAPAPPPPAPAPVAPPAAAAPLPPDAQPRLVVLRGLKRNVEYPIYEGHNFIGRADEKPVDIDLDDQEPPDRVWSSRQHALVTFEEGKLLVEDLNSANGTFVNRTRIYPGQKRDLAVGDVLQIGTVQMKLIV
ncbi:MAG TPA: FHA domain-containing protein [Gemmataceae bacterium]|nr:FHA domain-containing protein [Gemmataceae bacterium]